MPRGPKKHLKLLNAPSHWMLGKMDGTWAPRPSPGPHKLRECLPLVLILRNRLRYALNMQEVKMICMRRLVKVDGKVRTDTNFPAGFMDVIQLKRSGDKFRLLYDTKGRFILHRINKKEASYKLCRITKVATEKRGVPYVVTHDGRTLRYADPLINVGDTIRLNLKTNKIENFLHFEQGNLAYITKGRNAGRIGIVEHIERHPGAFDVVSIRDATGHVFSTRAQNAFIIGSGTTPWISLPRGRGVKLSILEERKIREKRSKKGGRRTKK